jgi:hypothetical protein
MALRRVVGLVLLFASTAAMADHAKTDVVTTDDGGTYIGDIRFVQYAALTLDTDPAGLLTIEWRHITAVQSKFEYRIELTGGIRHYGTLGPASKPDHLSIVADSGTIEVKLSDVVEIVPIAHGFWKRMDGSVNFGLTYTQANNALQYSLNGNASYRSHRNYATISGQSIFNAQSGAESTGQYSLKLTVAQVAAGKWGAFELAQLQSNPDQGYDLRAIGGGGAAYFLAESSRALASLNLGAVYDHENVTDSPDTDDSVEALIGIAYRRFKRGSHSPGVQLSLETFTNVTDTPRFRAVFGFNLAWEIFGNFTLNFQVNNSYDSKPPGTDANQNDLTLVTSFGYTF